MHALVLLVLVAACTSHRHPSAEEPEELEGASALDPGRASARRNDPDRLYVEINAERSHRRPLRDGAKAGLARIPFVTVLPANRGGDVELQVQVARLAVVGRETVCDIKILVLRLPQHELLGMAEGSARAGGTRDRSRSDCIASLGETLISGKIRPLLHKRLDEKR